MSAVSAIKNTLLMGFVLASTVVGVLVTTHDGGWSQVSNTEAKEFLLERPPTPKQLSTIPGDAGSILKVRLQRLLYLPGRDQSGRPPPLPKDLFMAIVKVIDVISGGEKVGNELVFYFGKPKSGIRYVYPFGRDVVGKEFFVVARLDDDKDRHLYGFPVSQERLESWEKRQSQYHRELSRPGAVQ